MGQTMIDIQQVPIHAINAWWRFVWPWLEPAVEMGGGCWTAGTLKTALLSGQAQLWVVADMEHQQPLMAVVTELRVFPQKKVCNIWLVGGSELELSLSVLEEIELWAKQQHADRIETTCRPGAAKKLKTLGYLNRYEVVTKELT